MNKDTILFDTIYSTLTHTFDKNKQTLFMNKIKEYISKNSEILFNDNVGLMLVFSDEDKSMIFEHSGITREFVLESVKKSNFIKSNWKNLNEPILHILFQIMKFFLLHKKDEEFKLTLLYLGFFFYMKSRQAFLKYRPNDDVMRFTLSNLSNKFHIKQYKTIYHMLEADLMTCHETYKKSILDKYDEGELRYLQQVQSRIHSSIKRIAIQFYDNYEKGYYLSTEVDIESDTKSLRVENNSILIENLAKKTTMKFLLERLDERILKICQNISKIGVSEIRNTLYNIKKNIPPEDIQKIITIILKIFLIDYEEKIVNIASSNFFLATYNIFNKSNTKNPDILYAKSTIEKWLEINSTLFQDSKRVSTKQSFRKAIFVYLTSIIQISFKT